MNEPRLQCPDCGAPVVAGQFFCDRCRLNLQVHGHRVVPEKPPVARRAAAQVERRIASILGLAGLAAVVGAVVAAVVVIPVGPDVRATDLETSIKAELAKKGPPSSGGATTEVTCSHPFFNTKRFTCEGRIDIALLPDAEFKLQVAVGNDDGRVCWGSGAGPESDSASGTFIEDVRSGCYDD